VWTTGGGGWPLGGDSAVRIEAPASIAGGGSALRPSPGRWDAGAGLEGVAGGYWAGIAPWSAIGPREIIRSPNAVVASP
jgi:hypothetical protein